MNNTEKNIIDKILSNRYIRDFVIALLHFCVVIVLPIIPMIVFATVYWQSRVSWTSLENDPNSYIPLTCIIIYSICGVYVIIALTELFIYYINVPVLPEDSKDNKDNKKNKCFFSRHYFRVVYYITLTIMVFGSLVYINVVILWITLGSFLNPDRILPYLIAIGALIGSAVAFAQSKYELLQSILREVEDQIKKFISTIIEEIGKEVKKITENVENSVKKVTAKVETGVNFVSGEVKDLSSSIGKEADNITEITKKLSPSSTVTNLTDDFNTKIQESLKKPTEILNNFTSQISNLASQLNSLTAQVNQNVDNRTANIGNSDNSTSFGDTINNTFSEGKSIVENARDFKDHLKTVIKDKKVLAILEVFLENPKVILALDSLGKKMNLNLDISKFEELKDTDEEKFEHLVTSYKKLGEKLQLVIENNINKTLKYHGLTPLKIFGAIVISLAILGIFFVFLFLGFESFQGIGGAGSTTIKSGLTAIVGYITTVFSESSDDKSKDWKDLIIKRIMKYFKSKRDKIKESIVTMITDIRNEVTVASN